MNLDRRDLLLGFFAVGFTAAVVGLPEPVAAATPSALDQINTRRLIIMIQGHMRDAIEDNMFEFNDAELRSNFRAWMKYVLDDYQARRALVDYSIVCDESNNTPELIDRNEFTADLYIKPTKGLNFIQLTAHVGRTSIPFEEVSLKYVKS